MDDYQLEALNFANKHGVSMIIKQKDYMLHFEGDKVKRWVFKIELIREGVHKFTFNFGQSISQDKAPPTFYDIFTCLTNYDPGTYEEFCDDFGYDRFDEDTSDGLNHSSERIYNAVCKEFYNVEVMFSDCMEELQEIQ